MLCHNNGALLDTGRRSLVFLHRACRRRRVRGPRRRALRHLHRALFGWRGRPRPLALQRGPDRPSARLTAFATAFGAWVDRRTSLAPLIIALAGSSVGYALVAVTTNFAALLVIAAVPVALGGAVFSQSIALVRRRFADASPHTAGRAIGVLRASWSLAWAIGPAVGAAVVTMFGFCGLFLTSSASAAIGLASLALARTRPVSQSVPPQPSRQAGERRADHRARFCSARPVSHRLVHGIIPLPIVLTTTLGGTETDVGIAVSLCAALEIVVMGALIWRPLKRGERGAIMAVSLSSSSTLSRWRRRARSGRCCGPKSPGDRDRARLVPRDQLPAVASSPPRRRRCGAVFERRASGFGCRSPGGRRSGAGVRLRLHLRRLRISQRRGSRYDLLSAGRTRSDFPACRSPPRAA